VRQEQEKHQSQTLHDVADKTLHNKVQKELSEENLKQILLTVQNLPLRQFLVGSLHLNLQNLLLRPQYLP
jgi:hypothetical protein